MAIVDEAIRELRAMAIVAGGERSHGTVSVTLHFQDGVADRYSRQTNIHGRRG